MIFLLNVKITDHRIPGPRFYREHTAQHYLTNARVDIFKYFLNSHSVLLPLISKCVFYIEMDADTIHRKDEVENYIRSLYPEDKLSLNWYRNNYANDWKNVYINELEKIDDDIIWLAGNDDHIFIDSNLDVVRNGLDILKNETDASSVIYYSHWPEQMYVASQLNAELHSDGNYVKFKWNNYDAIMALKKERFKSYWFDIESDKYSSELLFKPDVLVVMREPQLTTFYTPTKEIVRHFDGYGHVANLCNFTPPLIIPNGFFENNIRIKYGYELRDESYTNLNPLADNLYAENSSGTDYRWCLEDIPLFWRDKISEIDANGDMNDTAAKNNRNLYYINSAKVTNYHRIPYDIKFTGNISSDSWFVNHLL